ncbi:MAG: radical SAM protein [Terracidiphilus sp.]|jgi:MoaA/NifB/PqqE/SkfB family radical SAM enzyme
MLERVVLNTKARSRRVPSIKSLLKDVDPNLPRIFVPWALQHPQHLPAFFRLARAHRQTSRMRDEALERGMQVPPFLVLSVTSQCNLRCTGCFAGAVGITTGTPAARQPLKRQPLNLSDWHRVISEAAAVGVMGFVIAGGEPFLLPGIANLIRDFPDRMFLIFTNGTALHDRDYKILKSCRNTAVVVSLEGDRELTDERRGCGVYENALRSLDRLRATGVLTGLSITVGAANIDYWTDEKRIDAMMDRSGPLAFFIEQIPTGEGGGVVVPSISEEKRLRFRETVLRYRGRETGAAYLVHSPADEEFFGGCVAAGRGFAHVTPAGDFTACPFSALATHNVSTSTVSEALAGSFFTMIRDNGSMLETHDHPCALSANADKLETMAASLGAYRTDGANPASEHKLVELAVT